MSSFSLLQPFNVWCTLKGHIYLVKVTGDQFIDILRHENGNGNTFLVSMVFPKKKKKKKNNV